MSQKKKPYYAEISRESPHVGILVDPWWKTVHITHIKRGVNGNVILYRQMHSLTARPEV